MHMSNSKDFAIKSHSLQKYGDRPYSFHLEHVVLILNQSQLEDDPVLLDAAWLHDVVEDTEVTLLEIQEKFGSEVSDIVSRVSDEGGLNRQERKIKTYPKIRGHYKATVIKLCDRIANVEASKNFSRKLDMYLSEYPSFREALYVPSMIDSLWRRLDSTLDFEDPSGCIFEFWFSDDHGLIRTRLLRAEFGLYLSSHPEIIVKGQWVRGSPYVMDAITGMGEDPYSCGEYADRIELSEAIKLAFEKNIDLFEIKDC